jgi:hypothetical protein
MESIRWDRRQRCFILSNGISSDWHGEFALESALGVSLTSLRRALARRAGISIPPVGSLPAPESYGSWREFNEARLREPDAEVLFKVDDPWDVLFFHLTERGHLRAHFTVDYPVVTHEDTVTQVTERVFGEVCVLIQQLYYQSAKDDDYPYWSYEMICDPTGQTVGSFWNAYNTLCFTLTSFPSDLVKSSEGVQLALRLRRPDVLIGAPETSWLEAKSYDYRRLSSGAEKIKLAQDVARFANADGGLLVLGLKTSQSNGIDTVSRVTPLPLPSRLISHYRKTVDAHVYPFVRGLDVFSVPYGDGELLAIVIPSQSEDDKPFLVHGDLGSITDKKVRGQFVSVVQRRSDGAEYLSGPAIHGLLMSRRQERQRMPPSTDQE